MSTQTEPLIAPPSKSPAQPPAGRAPRFGDFGVKPRDRETVQAELNEAKAGFAVQERANTEFHEQRKIIEAMNKETVKDWAVRHPNMPLPPHRVPGLTPLPPLDSPVGREFYNLHYTIERLEKELEAAKQAETGR